MPKYLLLLLVIIEGYDFILFLIYSLSLFNVIILLAIIISIGIFYYDWLFFIYIIIV